MDSLAADQEKRKDQYQAKQLTKVSNIQPGDYVSVRVLSPRKGESKWAPGYVVLDTRGPALRIKHTETHKTVRVNAERVRVIPAQKPYDEVDPLPPPRSSRKAFATKYPEQAQPLAVDPPTHTPPLHVPAAAAVREKRDRNPQEPVAARNDTWKAWCARVHRQCNLTD